MHMHNNLPEFIARTLHITEHEANGLIALHHRLSTWPDPVWTGLHAICMHSYANKLNEIAAETKKSRQLSAFGEAIATREVPRMLEGISTLVVHLTQVFEESENAERNAEL